MAGGLVYTAVGSEAMATAEYYGKAMCDLGKEHPEIVALTADLAGSTKIGVFRKEFPERFFNVGIAEQNMFGIAAGMAKAGLVPFVSTMSAFATMRVADQIHADICYQNVNVKIIGSHAGTFWPGGLHPPRDRGYGLPADLPEHDLPLPGGRHGNRQCNPRRI